MRPDGEFGLISIQILGENAVTVRATLSQTGRASRHQGTISEQPFKFATTPSHKPQVFQAPSLEGRHDDAWHWQPVARGLRILAFAARLRIHRRPVEHLPLPTGAWRHRCRRIILPDRYQRRSARCISERDPGCRRGSSGNCVQRVLLVRRRTKLTSPCWGLVPGCGVSQQPV